MDLSSANPRHQLPYEGYLLKIRHDRSAWWGEVFFSKFVSCTGPHETYEEALRSTKLKAWKKKLEFLQSPAAIVNFHSLVIEYQNTPSEHLFGDRLHRKVSELISYNQIEFLRNELDLHRHFRTRLRIFNWRNTLIEEEFSGEIIEVPDKFVICQLSH